MTRNEYLKLAGEYCIKMEWNHDAIPELAECLEDHDQKFTSGINAIEINARANEEAADRATEARDIAWSQGVAAGLRLALSYLPNVQAQRIAH
jgi:hypothetical protein